MQTFLLIVNIDYLVVAVRLKIWINWHMQLRVVDGHDLVMRLVVLWVSNKLGVRACVCLVLREAVVAPL